jgi:hypothetical protein
MSEVLNSSVALEEATPIVDAEPCAYCGAPVEKGDRFCVHCGSEQPVAAQVAEPPPEQKHFRCKSCGAQVAVDPDQRSYTCAFCDSNYVVELSPDQTGRQAPEFVIGFAVTREKAMERFREWLGRNNWFRPGDLKSARIDRKLVGVYLPFWSFSMLAKSRWSASIGEYWYRTETYTTTENGKTVTKTRRVRETEWWPLSGKHHQYYSFYLVSGSHSLDQARATQIKPYHLAALKRYDPKYLAGWTNEEYTVEREDALRTCKAEFARREEQNVAAFLPGDTYRSLSVDTGFSQIHSDLILLPVYLLSYKYRDKLYQFLLNGQTGRSAGTKPVSWWRIGAAVGGLLAVIAAIALAIAMAGGM